MKGYTKRLGVDPSYIITTTDLIEGLLRAISVIEAMPPHQTIVKGKRPVRRITDYGDCIAAIRAEAERIGAANLLTASEASR